MTGRITIIVNGAPLLCRQRVTVAAALLEAELGTRFRLSRQLHEPRNLFCGMGVCFECLVTIDGRAEMRACMTQVDEGMRVETS